MLGALRRGLLGMSRRNARLKLDEKLQVGAGGSNLGSYGLSTTLVPALRFPLPDHQRYTAQVTIQAGGAESPYAGAVIREGLFPENHARPFYQNGLRRSLARQSLQ